MERILEFYVKTGLRPLSLLPETAEWEQKVNRSELTALILLHLYGEQTMSQLAADLGAPLSTVTSLTKRMARKGLIERVQSDKDQRMILARITEQGEQLAQQARSFMESVIARVESALTKEELQQFMSIAVKIGKALQGDGQGNRTAGRSSGTIRNIRIDD
ncbi:hypothetical protein PAE9249_01909 [Paenibacillus sp. CECT 9249]|uniref:MarR family winged helix-turn-helix transcriptional regulator n=1 Tax=Paenibacillus sp. CECT 9249 TaxID=2845385 RepID=UPI001E60828E|nr:MarR family transcriptional regulator [Paenibacillus sp. CECT 9249]CAH0119408.1 hypothetical protein PAE9249_01909 [Paenibacillus sp. CECT 9249]